MDWLEYGRARQARGLVALLAGNEPTILAGDFNTWFGFSDQAYIETPSRFRRPRVDRRRRSAACSASIIVLSSSAGWRADFRRADDRFGSDHYPLVGTLQFS